MEPNEPAPTALPNAVTPPNGCRVGVWRRICSMIAHCSRNEDDAVAEFAEVTADGEKDEGEAARCAETRKDGNEEVCARSCAGAFDDAAVAVKQLDSNDRCRCGPSRRMDCSSRPRSSSFRLPHADDAAVLDPPPPPGSEPAIGGECTRMAADADATEAAVAEVGAR